MKSSTVTTTLLWVLSARLAEASAPVHLPTDVEEFVARRESCEHFRGEDPYDAERAAYLERAVTELCRGMDRQLAELKLKYRGSAEVVAALAVYEETIEP